MTMFQAPIGAVEPIRAVLGTSLADVVPASDDKKQPIGVIRLCNVTSGAITVDVAVYDGTTAFYVEKGLTLAANASREIRDEILQVGHSLQMLASAGASIHAHVLFQAPGQLI